MKSRSRSHAVALLLSGFLLLVAGAARAESDSTSTGSRTALHAGARALQFQIGPNFTLGSLQGTTLSYQKMRSDRSGWKVGLSLNIGFSDTHSQDSTTYAGQSSVRGSSSNADGQSYGLSLQCVHYPSPQSRVGMFWETGPFTTYSRNRNSTGPGENYHESLSHSWALGWGAGLGVQWFVSRRISLHSQYGLQLVFTRGSSTDTNRSSGAVAVRETISHSYRLIPAPVTAGVSLFF